MDFNANVIFNLEMDSCREKVFYLPRIFQSSWTGVRPICMAYGMDFVSLETAHEHDRFLEICKNNAAVFPAAVHVGAMTKVLKSPNEWFSVNSGNRITYQINWASGQPKNDAGNEYCLHLKKVNNNFVFHDAHCTNLVHNFVCQRYLWKGC